MVYGVERKWLPAAGGPKIPVAGIFMCLPVSVDGHKSLTVLDLAGYRSIV